MLVKRASPQKKSLLPDLGHLFLQWQSVSAGTVLSEQEWLLASGYPGVQEERLHHTPTSGFTLLLQLPLELVGVCPVAIKFLRPCFSCSALHATVAVLLFAKSCPALLRHDEL